MVKKNEDVVRFCIKGLMAARSKVFTLVCCEVSLEGKKVGSC